jgi:formaldehyde-activating enzyme
VNHQSPPTASAGKTAAHAHRVEHHSAALQNPRFHFHTRIGSSSCIMAKKKALKKKTKPGRIVLRTGEALVESESGPGYLASEPEVVIGELDGPVGFAIANLIGDQTKGHSRVFAILNCDVQVRPTTLMVSKVTVNSEKYTNILMGSVQAGIANGVLDAVRAGDLPIEKADDLGIIVSVWLDPSVLDADKVDHEGLFETNRAATAKAIGKAMYGEPKVDWLLKNQKNITHYFHQLGVEGQL